MQAWFGKSWLQGESSLFVLELEMLFELCVILHTASYCMWDPFSLEESVHLQYSHKKLLPKCCTSIPYCSASYVYKKSMPNGGEISCQVHCWTIMKYKNWFFLRGSRLTLDRDINGQNYIYCGGMKISMQFIKFLHKYLIQWGKRGKLVLISHFLYPLHFFLWQSCSMYQ